MSPAPITPLEQAYLDAATRGDHTEAARLGTLVDAEHDAKLARLSAPGAILDAAIWYATTLGLPVFPCAPGEKRPATPRGFHDATTDETQIRAWWKVNPYYNVAAPTGILFDAFDVDGPAGLIALGEYMDQGGFPTPLGLSLTPRGRHYLVPPADVPNTTNLLPKVDYRGRGGYIIMPPSRTPAGSYWWDTPLTPNNNAQEMAA